MAFRHSEADITATPLAEIGPAIWPVAMPTWMDGLTLPARNHAAGRAGALGLVLGLHLVVVATLLTYREALDLRQIGERSRLTLIRIAGAVEETPEPARKPDSARSPTEEMSKAQPIRPIEWTRVRNWRPQRSSAPAQGEAGSDATLLAGLGSIGPAGAQEGVVDAYAGAAPIWSRTKSPLLLLDAPNPAVLEEIRQLVALRFPGLRGSARIIVKIDHNGVIAGFISMESNLPDAAQRLLRQALAGRVIAKPAQEVATEQKLPDIHF